VFTHAPPQAVCPVAQAIVHWPMLQTCPLLQVLPQLPQLFASLASFTQLAPHRLGLAPMHNMTQLMPLQAATPPAGAGQGASQARGPQLSTAMSLTQR
jgi:hypothetical protein